MIKGAGKTIQQAVTAWEQVTAHPHRFGGTEFQFGTREIGHIHGDYMVDISFPKKIMPGKSFVQTKRQTF